ncbi:hypothetical protein ABZ446_26510 [Streptomyces sp. NPDC005813]|uniref:hypothetical protein n=1 Tax=Streptomyces sp. NPDC005813 TaxID=3155592 RepID=UPI0033D7CFE4
MPAPGTGGSGGNGDGGGGSGSPGGGDGGGGAKPGPLKIPEWGRNGFLFDDGTDAGKTNWTDIKNLFAAQCKDGTLCVNLVRVYRTEDGRPSSGPCGYDHVEPAADTWIMPHRTVYVVGVCATDTGGPGEGGESGPPGETGTTGDPGESGGSPDDELSPSIETVPAT